MVDSRPGPFAVQSELPRPGGDGSSKIRRARFRPIKIGLGCVYGRITRMTMYEKSTLC